MNCVFQYSSIFFLKSECQYPNWQVKFATKNIYLSSIETSFWETSWNFCGNIFYFQTFLDLLQIDLKHIIYYNTQASQTCVTKYDWWSLCEIKPSYERNTQQLFRVGKRNTTLREEKQVSKNAAIYQQRLLTNFHTFSIEIQYKCLFWTLRQPPY